MSLHLDAGSRAGPASPPPPEATARTLAQRRWSSRRGRFDHKISPYIYVAPFFVLFGVFGLYPLVYTAWVSLRNWDYIGGDKGFVGLQNYTELLKDDWFTGAVFNTVGMFIVATVPQLLLALMLAYALNRQMRARTLFRMGILVPNITSVVAVGIIFAQLFSRDWGLINWVLGLVGIDQIDWRASQWASWTAISTMVDWRWTGYNSLIFLAAMQAIPKDLYESAAIDGASTWRQFWKITVPLLRPTIIFAVIISTIGGLQLFTEPLVFIGGNGAILGGSERQAQTVTMFLVETAFRRFDFGYGAAIAWLLFLLIMFISIINVWIVRRLSAYGSTKAGA